MGEVIQYSTSSHLTDRDTLRAIEAITGMLESYAQRPPGMSDFVRAFVGNIDDLPLSLIEKFAGDFARGRVSGRNNAFPPSSAEFHAAATEFMQGDLVRARAKERIEDTLKSINTEPPPKTEASKARIDELTNAFKAQLTEERDAAKAEERRAYSEKMNAELEKRAKENDGQVSNDGTGAALMASLENLKQEREAREFVESADKIRERQANG